MIILKSEREIQYMREAGRVVARTRAELEKAVAPGVRTRDLDQMAEEFIRKQGATPAFLGYNDFPATLCTSINGQVVHGIPGPRRLQEGDILSIDFGAILNGYYSDAAATFPVGKVTEEAARLMRVTRESLERAIQAAYPGNHLSDISFNIQSWVEEHGFSVVRDYVGHGIGRKLHEDPQVPNFGPPGMGPVLRPGMTLAIEPMVNQGGYQVHTEKDNWTVVTDDGSLSAHFEETIAILEDGPEILTKL
ncbi:MAG: type I methionyl aminopeptidase [Firmicutes bacterium]|nr:type I methionyl aminopeptidase [Bacillota bacterium]